MSLGFKRLIGATGTILKSFIKYPTKIPGKHEMKKLQKTAMGTLQNIQN